VAGGVAGAVDGFTTEVAARLDAWSAGVEGFVAGIGGTLAGAALGLAAMRAALDHVLTDAAYARMDAQARRLAEGWEGVIAARAGQRGRGARPSRRHARPRAAPVVPQPRPAADDLLQRGARRVTG